MPLTRKGCEMTFLLATSFRVPLIHGDFIVCVSILECMCHLSQASFQLYKQNLAIVVIKTFRKSDNLPIVDIFDEVNLFIIGCDHISKNSIKNHIREVWEEICQFFKHNFLSFDFDFL